MDAIRGTHSQLERRGFKFEWPESVYRVHIHYHGRLVGTFDTLQPLSIPHDVRIVMLKKVRTA